MTEQQLPEGWQMVKFGDIAKHISKRVEPSETDLEIYVGLEHLDPDSLKIKRHGVPSDVAGQKLLVKKGQIIFGKRRAYQRKVAVADWDCICSAHAMVLEANPKHVIPEFLPFFMQSDVFMNRAVAISEGSLSPTIKWKVLESQTFKLPPIDRQNELLKICKKIDSAILKNEATTRSFTKFNSVLSKTTFEEVNEFRPLKELCNVTSSKRIMRSEYVKSGVPFFRSKEIIELAQGKKIDDILYISESRFRELDNKFGSPKAGDILVSSVGTIGICYLKNNNDPFYFKDGNLLWLRDIDKSINPQYLLAYLSSDYGQALIKNLSGGSSQKALTINKLESMLVPQLDKDLQDKIAASIQLQNEMEACFAIKTTAFRNIKNNLLGW